MTTEGLRGEIVRWMGRGGGGGDGIGKTFPARAFARAPEPPGDGFPEGNLPSRLANRTAEDPSIAGSQISRIRGATEFRIIWSFDVCRVVRQLCCFTD